MIRSKNSIPRPHHGATTEQLVALDKVSPQGIRGTTELGFEAPVGDNGLAKFKALGTQRGVPFHPSDVAVRGGPSWAKGRSMKASLQHALRTIVREGEGVGSSRGPDNAYAAILAGREAIWSSVDRLVAEPTKGQPKALRHALGELEDFRDDWRSSKDEANMPRIFGGKTRGNVDGTFTRLPGLEALLDNVFTAAGLPAVCRES